MAAPDDQVLDWIVSVAAPSARVAAVTGLRDGASPWLISMIGPGATDVVLRLGDDTDALSFATEVAGLQAAGAHGVPVPGLVAADLDGRGEAGTIAVLTTRVPGTSRLTAEPSASRLRASGAALALVHGVPVPSSPALPPRRHSIGSVDFDALRRAAPARPLLVRAENEISAMPMPTGPDVFVHGDFWQGNTMWHDDVLTGIIDWDCAGVGRPGVDIGSMRCDAAMAAGLDAADEALAGYESATGRPADDVAYWDVVAGLSTPPTIDWFVQAIQDQGRVDLDQATLLARRDAFVQQALGRLT